MESAYGSLSNKLFVTKKTIPSLHKKFVLPLFAAADSSRLFLAHRKVVWLPPSQLSTHADTLSSHSCSTANKCGHFSRLKSNTQSSRPHIPTAHMLLGIGQNAFPRYALRKSSLNMACSLADELDTKLLILLLCVQTAWLSCSAFALALALKCVVTNWVNFCSNSVTKQARLPDDLYEYKQRLYNWAHHVRNQLHSIPFHALQAGMTTALQAFSSVYGECQTLRREASNDAVSFICPRIKSAVQDLGKSC